MNMMTKYYCSILIIISLFLLGCSSIGKGIGEGVEKGIKETHALYFSLVWYYNFHDNWPNSQKDLEGFINEHKASIDLTKYSEITLSEDKMGNMKCHWVIKKGLFKSSGHMLIYKSHIEKEAFPIPSLNEGIIELSKPTMVDS